MRKLCIVLCLSWLSILVKAQEKVSYTPYFQLGGMYYKSEQITIAGAGPGIGLSIGIDKHLLVKSDINIFWINGNAGSFRVALGYKKNGIWAPAGYVGISSLFGDRTELLLEDGSRPVSPVFAVGIQVSPLRFEAKKGFVSVLAMGYGIGNYKGKNLEISLLSVGIKL